MPLLLIAAASSMASRGLMRTRRTTLALLTSLHTTFDLLRATRLLEALHRLRHLRLQGVSLWKKKTDLGRDAGDASLVSLEGRIGVEKLLAGLQFTPLHDAARLLVLQRESSV